MSSGGHTGFSFVDPAGAVGLPLWANAPQNFDSFNNAMLSLFELFTLEAWPVRDPPPRGLSSNTMALITTKFDAMRSLRTKWP